MSNNNKPRAKKNNLPILIIALIVVGAVYFFITTQPANDDQVKLSDIKDKAKDVAETTGEFFGQKRENYSKAVDQKIAEYKKEIAALKAEASELDSSSRTALQKKIKTMSTQVDSLQKKAGNLKDTSGEAWVDLKNGIDGALEKLKEGMSEAKSNFAKK